MSELSRFVTMHEEGRQGSFVGKPPPPKSRRQIDGDDNNGGNEDGGEEGQGLAEGDVSPKRKKHRVELPADDNVPWGYSTRPAAESYSYKDGRKAAASKNASAEGRSSLEDVFPSVRGRGGKTNVGSRMGASS